jgi:dipeptidyl aminopeptidase/acylaminoacyl peptidase
MKDISYESDKNRIVVVSDITKNLTASEFYANEEGTGDWDTSPSTLLWSQDGQTIYASAEDKARVRLFSLPSSPERALQPPQIIFRNGGVSDFHPLGKSKLLVSSTSFIDNSLFSAVDPVVAASSNGTDGITTISSNTDNGKKYGLSQDQISEFYYQGAGDYQVQAWIIKPSFFQENETYPLAFYIHGGPQGSTSETWRYILCTPLFDFLLTYPAHVGTWPYTPSKAIS